MDYRDIINKGFEDNLKTMSLEDAASKSLKDALETGPGIQEKYLQLNEDQIKKIMGYSGGSVKEYVNDYTKTLFDQDNQPANIRVIAPSKLPDKRIQGQYYGPADSIIINSKADMPLSVIEHEAAHRYDYRNKPYNSSHLEMGDANTLRGFMNQDQGPAYMKSIGMVGDNRNLYAQSKNIPEANKYELSNLGHHYRQNGLVDRIAELSKPDFFPLEKRLALARMIKNMGLKSVAPIAQVSSIPGAVMDYNEASKDPNITDDEKKLRIMNAIYPNEQMGRDIEYKKMIRDSLSS